MPHACKSARLESVLIVLISLLFRYFQTSTKWTGLVFMKTRSDGVFAVLMSLNDAVLTADVYKPSSEFGS